MRLLCKTNYIDEEVELVWHKYENGRPALELKSNDAEPMAMASVNLPDVPLEDAEMAIKDYSENEGMWAWLLKEGIIEDTGRVVQSGFVDVKIGKIVFDVKIGD